MALICLTGCEKEISNDKTEMLAAIAYITYGIEEGNNKFSAERVDRQLLSDGVEYLVYSKRDGPVGLRLRIKNPTTCLFTVDTRGDGKGYLETVDLNKCTEFEFGSAGFAFVQIEGPKVYCKNDECEDSKLFLVLEQRGEIDLPENRALASRRVRAIDFLKQTCKGKPF